MRPGRVGREAGVSLRTWFDSRALHEGKETHHGPSPGKPGTGQSTVEA
jgi:hypothetical protein